MREGRKGGKGGARMMGAWEGRRADAQVRESAATRDEGTGAAMSEAAKNQPFFILNPHSPA